MPENSCKMRQAGFTMVELLITMTLFILAILAATNIFVPLLTQFKQQSKVAETQIDGIVGLETLRRDIEQAGFGLPWSVPSAVTTATYSEASSSTTSPIPAPNSYNDAPTVPRAFVSGNDIANLGTPNGSDYLVIKSAAVAANDAASKWAYVVGQGGGLAGKVKSWGTTTEDPGTNYRVVVLIPSRGTSESSQRILVSNSSGGYTVSFNTASFSGTSVFSPTVQNDLFLIYSVDPNTDLRMPFNRADYYIRRVTGTTIPQRCASGTGILMKSVISHADGGRSAGIPLMDCVADFQVVFGLDMDDNGEIGTYANADGSAVTGSEGATVTAVQTILANPSSLRERLKEVKIYILAHEGQYDPNYTYPSSTITMPVPQTPADPAAGMVRTFNFASSNIDKWQNYKWKVYSMAVKTRDLR